MKKKIIYLTFEDVFTHGVLQAMVIMPTIEISKLKPDLQFEIIAFSRIADRSSYTYKQNKSEPMPTNIKISEFLKFGSKKSRGFLGIINIFYAYILVFPKIFKADVIHIRSYAFIPFAILGSFLSKKVIWDPRGILSMEIEDLDGSKSLTTNLLFYLEKVALLFSDSIICVSNKMKDYFLNRSKKAIVVIPNPTKLKNYNPNNKLKIINIVYSGRLLKWHSKNSILTCYRTLKNSNKEFVFNLLTPDISLAYDLFKDEDINPNNLNIRSCAIKEIPAILDKAHIGLCLIEPSKSKKYCAPVKFAEYLAAEMLVLGNLNIGDVSDYILETGNGAVIQNLDSENVSKGLKVLIEKVCNNYIFNKEGLMKYTWESNINILISLYD